MVKILHTKLKHYFSLTNIVISKKKSKQKRFVFKKVAPQPKKKEIFFLRNKFSTKKSYLVIRILPLSLPRWPIFGRNASNPICWSRRTRYTSSACPSSTSTAFPRSLLSELNDFSDRDPFETNGSNYLKIFISSLKLSNKLSGQ